MALFTDTVRSSRRAMVLAVLLAFATIGGATPRLFSQEHFAANSMGNLSSDGSTVRDNSNLPGTVSPANVGTAPIIPPDLTPEQAGDLHMAHRRYQQAIEAYHLASLNTAGIWNKIGIANQQMFILSEAQKSYENSLRIDPRNPDVINNLGTVYYSLKDYSKAERLYRKAIQYDPKSALIYKNLGTAYLAEHKNKQGWACFQTALQIDPQVFEGTGHFHIGDPTPSTQLGAMNYYLAKSYMMAGMADRAIDYLRMALDEGYTDRRKIMADKEFAGLRSNPAFQQLVTERRGQ